MRNRTTQPTPEAEAGMVRITRDTTGVDFPCGVYADIAGPVNPRLLASYARLFALAPEMLAALEMAESYISHGEGREPNGVRMSTALESIRLLVRRARGEA